MVATWGREPWTDLFVTRVDQLIEHSRPERGSRYPRLQGALDQLLFQQVKDLQAVLGSRITPRRIGASKINFARRVSVQTAALDGLYRPVMRVVHSLLHPDDLAGLVECEYDVPGPVRVRLLHRGFNDTYVVTDATGKRRALRVYSRDKYWIRSTSDVWFELELLEHLAMAGRWVTRPYPRRGGGFLGTVPAPEGERGYAVFGYAPGPSVSDQPMAVERWHAFGSEISRMHRCMDEFRSEYDRYHLDLGILLDMPLAAIEPYVAKQGKPRYTELCELAERLRAYVSSLELPPDAYGLIHADLHDGNVNIGSNGELMCFDFDHCGYGWRGYDLAALFRGPDSPETERAQWSALLAGYETVRPLHPDERAALPVFAACRAFWNIGDWLWTVDRNGQIWANDRLCERMLSDARQPLAGLDW